MQNMLVELGLRVEPGKTVVVNSRDISRVFDKLHHHVLRDIDELLQKSTEPDLVALKWFRPLSYLDEKGETRRSFDLTRDGFTLLAMGWTGERAIAFKVAYIEAFNRMEQALRDGTPVTTSELLQAIREIVGPLAIRFDGQDRVIERIETRVDRIAEDVGSIKLRLDSSRRRINEATKAEHIDANKQLGGLCHCCSIHHVIIEGEKAAFAEFDHFYQVNLPDADHTWLICKPCHTGFTSNRVPRHKYESHFRAYQEKRRDLPGRQKKMFF